MVKKVFFVVDNGPSGCFGRLKGVFKGWDVVRGLTQRVSCNSQVSFSTEEEALGHYKSISGGLHPKQKRIRASTSISTVVLIYPVVLM